MPGIVFKRSAALSAFDERLSIHFGDFVLLMRIAERYDVFFSSEALVQIRLHRGQASASMPLSQGIPLRTRTLLDYCDEYLGRHPDEVNAVKLLRRRIRLLHRVGLVWGWASAASLAEANACSSALGATPGDAALRGLMRTAERWHVRDALMNPRYRDAVRRAGGAIGV